VKQPTLFAADPTIKRHIKLLNMSGKKGDALQSITIQLCKVITTT